MASKRPQNRNGRAPDAPTQGKKQKSSPDYASFAVHLHAMREASGDDASSKPDAGLYVTAVPIGNLGDITLRALDVLARCDAVACEDTRVTGGLLQRYGIKQKLISYHDHNADGRQPELLALIAGGAAVALVTDAGTPLVSDPGFRLVRACREAGLMVTALPGASALLAAVATAGLPSDHVLFAGFLPVKAAARVTALEGLSAVAATLVFYETAPRLKESLAALASVLGGGRQAAVARELTKLFETVETGTLASLATQFDAAAMPKGEIVIVVGPPGAAPRDEKTDAPVVDEMLSKALRTLSLRDAVAAVAGATGWKKTAVYERALALSEENGKAKSTK